MKTMMIAAVLGLTPMAAQAQTAAVGQPVEAPVLPGATLDAACGNLYDLAGKAFCITAPLATIGGLADAYIAHFEGEGWIAAAGDDNRVVFIKRRDGGGCDGMQFQAFYNPNRPAAPDAPGYLAMATIPGDVCAAAPAAPETPAEPAAATPQ